MSDEDKVPPSLLYNEEKFPAFEQQLLGVLLLKNRANRHLLKDVYTEADLPDDPIRQFEKYLTPTQKARYDARITATQTKVPTKLEVLEDPEDPKIQTWLDFITAETTRGDNDANRAVTAVRLQKYTDTIGPHLEHETRIWKICLTTLCNTTRYYNQTPTGAGRQLLRLMRDNNRQNVTEQDSNEMFDQFMTFRMHQEEYKDVALYHQRLKDLIK